MPPAEPRADAERCPTCDRPPVTDKHYHDAAHYPPGEDSCSCALCMSFCWRLWNEADCEANRVDWRPRALSSSEREATLRAAVGVALARAEEAHRHCCEPDERHVASIVEPLRFALAAIDAVLASPPRTDLEKP